MAVGMIARVTVLPGKNAEFEAAFKTQADGVRANEPENKLYKLFKARDEDNKYMVMEIYESEEAIKVHVDAPHMVANRPTIRALMDGAVQVERFDAV